MALGAADKYPDLKLTIVPVGLNYFHGHRFRGRAYVEYGDPIHLTPELKQAYKAGGDKKKEACNTLLETIREHLQAVNYINIFFSDLFK
jgi:glycerol-3-phosphate O-acyltransferase/dihydroxyacetone phosphate acyltransferase